MRPNETSPGRHSTSHSDDCHSVCVAGRVDENRATFFSPRLTAAAIQLPLSFHISLWFLGDFYRDISLWVCLLWCILY